MKRLPTLVLLLFLSSFGTARSWEVWCGACLSDSVDCGGGAVRFLGEIRAKYVFIGFGQDEVYPESPQSTRLVYGDRQRVAIAKITEWLAGQSHGKLVFTADSGPLLHSGAVLDSDDDIVEAWVADMAPQGYRNSAILPAWYTPRVDHQDRRVVD